MKQLKIQRFSRGTFFSNTAPPPSLPPLFTVDVLLYQNWTPSFRTWLKACARWFTHQGENAATWVNHTICQCIIDVNPWIGNVPWWVPHFIILLCLMPDDLLIKVRVLPLNTKCTLTAHLKPCRHANCPLCKIWMDIFIKSFYIIIKYKVTIWPAAGHGLSNTKWPAV
jgi:hypothetical protein